MYYLDFFYWTLLLESWYIKGTNDQSVLTDPVDHSDITNWTTAACIWHITEVLWYMWFTRFRIWSYNKLKNKSPAVPNNCELAQATLQNRKAQHFKTPYVT